MIDLLRKKAKVMKEVFGFDAFSPKEIANRVDSIGVTKVQLPILSMIMLGIMAGVFIGLGAMYYVLVVSDPNLGFASSRILGGLSFSLGLIMVVVAGAELFTGNNLLAMAWADGKVTTIEVLKNWGIVCCANFIGAIIIAFLVYHSGHLKMNNGLIESQYLKIAVTKCSISPERAIFSGMLCNILVCLAVWMSFAGRSVLDKIVAIILPVSAFVAAGFEHSIANMYFIIMGIFLKGDHPEFSGVDTIGLTGFFNNLGPVIAGNLIGGSVFVAIVYYIIYKRGGSTKP